MSRKIDIRTNIETARAGVQKSLISLKEENNYDNPETINRLDSTLSKIDEAQNSLENNSLDDARKFLTESKEILDKVRTDEWPATSSEHVLYNNGEKTENYAEIQLFEATDLIQNAISGLDNIAM